MSHQLSKKVLESLHDKNICPRPKWRFALANCTIWLLSVVFLVIGSLASAVMIYMIKTNDWDLSDRLFDSSLGFAFATLPYFWILLLFLFILVAFYQIKQTKGGYRYRIYSIIAVTFILSILLGQIFYNFGLGQQINFYLADNFDIYDQTFCQYSSTWHKPERGIIIGTITGASGQQIIVKDLGGKDWDVAVEKVKMGSCMSPGYQVKIIGDMVDLNGFLAEDIRIAPCGCHREMNNHACGGCSAERK